MSDSGTLWAARGAAYAASEVHRLGPSLPRIAGLVRPLRSDHILDLGTGTGHTAAFLARWCQHITGVDPEPGMLRAALDAYGERPELTFVQGSGQHLPFAGGRFDAVVARHTLHHHPDVPATLREVHRVLRPGGRFVLVDETAPAPEHAAWLERLERVRDPSHVAIRSLDTWWQLLRDAGFLWITGDARTRYRIDVASWLERMKAPPEARDEVHAILREASPALREAFAIEVDGDVPQSFDLPMNIVLALKEGS